MKRINDKDKALAIKMRESGDGFQKIADHLGCSVSAVWNYLRSKEIGIITTKEKKELIAENKGLKRAIREITAITTGILKKRK